MPEYIIPWARVKKRRHGYKWLPDMIKCMEIVAKSKKCYGFSCFVDSELVTFNLKKMRIYARSEIEIVKTDETHHIIGIKAFKEIIVIQFMNEEDFSEFLEAFKPQNNVVEIQEQIQPESAPSPRMSPPPPYESLDSAPALKLNVNSPSGIHSMDPNLYFDIISHDDEFPY